MSQCLYKTLDALSALCRASHTIGANEMKTRLYLPHHTLFRLFWMFTALLTLFAHPALAQKNDLLVGDDSGVLRFDGNTGALLGDFVTQGSGGLSGVQDMTYGADGNLYVSSWNTGSIKRYNGTTGAYMDDFVPSGSGGLSNPDQVVFGPDGRLYVSDRFSARILRYNGTTGAFKDVFVSDNRLGGFVAFSFGPDGNLYASMFNPYDINQSILRYDGTTGAFKDVFASAPDGGSAWSGIAFGTDGSLYACRYHTGEVWHFNTHTGALLGTMRCPFPRADYLTFGPEGSLYVCSCDLNGNNSSVQRFNVQTGQSAGFASAGLQGLPKGVVFMSKATPVESDFDQDGKTDLLWQNQMTGQLVYWLMDGVNIKPGGSGRFSPSVVNPVWKMVSTPDLDGDGHPDLIWQNLQTGGVVYWLMNGTTQVNSGWIVHFREPQWRLVATPDLNGDGHPDLLWQNLQTGGVVYWLMNGTTPTDSGWIVRSREPQWRLVSAPDINGDGHPDLLWQNLQTGGVVYWLMNGTTIRSSGWVVHFRDPQWRLVSAPDINGDGHPDLLWQNLQTGGVVYWLMNGTIPTDSGWIVQYQDPQWQLAANP